MNAISGPVDRTSPSQAKIALFRSLFRSFPDDAAIHYAQIRADLKTRGQMIGANDLFIAAHARSLGLTLVTNNTAEFGRVKGLTLENWTLAVRRSRSRDDQ